MHRYAKTMTELALPAGSLQSALIAFKEGADAVYLGMKQFSARAMATNFSFEDLSKLRAEALATQKKIYVTVNTLADETQLDELYRLLKEVAHIGCDGIIVQDLGLVRMIKNQFPNLALHGSTQLAVHTIEGVNELVRLGFERVVLARELAFEEIKKIREACPDVQLKVFIHGALCYSFSGLCTASEQLCKRSANCGSCAQICRNYFTVEQDSQVPPSLSPLPANISPGWYFSMSDLSASHVAKDLAELGIDSLKVEGRMKGPAYTAMASRTYRAILDGSENTNELEEGLSIVFSRRQTAGWLAGYGRKEQDFSPRKTPTLGSVSYPGHRGIKVATIASVGKDSISLRLEKDISLRDGMMYFIKAKQEPVDVFKFGLFHLLDQRGRSITHALANEQVTIRLPERAPRPHAGEHLFVISRHDQTPALLNENLPIFKKPVDCKIIIANDSVTIQGGGLEARFEIEARKAKSEQQLKENLQEIFSQSDTSNFSLGFITIENTTLYRMNELFIPISVLKRIRRSWYETLDRGLARSFLEPFEKEEVISKRGMRLLPSRSQLTTDEKLPYLDLKKVKERLEANEPLSEVLFFSDDSYYLPLSPVIFHEEQFFSQLSAVIALLDDRNALDQVLFGLNNIGQIPFFRKNKLSVFIDIYLYLTNSQAAMSFLDMGLDLVGGYLWMERKNSDFSAWPFVPTIVDDAFQAPLFISRSCFRYDSLHLSCSGCPRNGSWYVKGDKSQFRVLVHDCITTVVRA